MDLDGPAIGGASSLSPTSPTSVRSLGAAANGGFKRKRSSGAAGNVKAESSPESGVDENDEDHPDRKRQPGVKRACNECRQQKLRCDVVQDPFESCSRCKRLRLECKIESNFKRIGKRSKHAEMEREIECLRRAVQQARDQGFVVVEDDEDMVGGGGGHSQLHSPVVNSVYTHTRNPSLMGSDEAVSSLLNLKRGGSYSMPRIVRELEDTVRLAETDEIALFEEFFTCYHPHLPFLNPAQSPDQYYQQHPLLYWSIVAVAARRYTPDLGLLTNLAGPLTRLLWSTVGDVPGSHYPVKALCLLCTWPLPTSTTSSDPTHILCGVMMKTATGIGLHRPNHINDFSRVAVELNKEQLHDRVTTWGVCNIVAQTIGTGYGQPASTLYDWTLAVRPGDCGPFTLSSELEARLQIERFCDKVSKEMYSNASDPRGVAGDEHRAMLMRVYRREFGELVAAILSRNLSPVVNLHLRAAGLHLRLAGFFDASTTPGYMDDLMGLWRATTTFLDCVLDNDIRHPYENMTPEFLLRYASNYMQQMLVAAGFALLKLMRSFFVKSIELERGRALFHRTVQAIRTASVVHNDLNWRLAELMVQMWNGARLDTTEPMRRDDDTAVQVDDSLQLKVRCRHSMSLVFDSIWHWREEYQARGRGTLDALKHPTHPDSANESSASSTHLDSTLVPPSHTLPTSLGIAASNGALTPNAGSGLGGGGGSAAAAAAAAAAAGPHTSSLLSGLGYPDPNYDVWDPQHWMLDGLLDFNYTYAPALEGA